MCGLFLCTAFGCWAQDDGGRDVRVALFSAQPPRAVSVAAAGPGAWWARCAGCERKPFKAPLLMPAVREIVAGGPITVRDAQHAQVRTADGAWQLREGSDGIVEVILTLPSERYVGAVLMASTTPGEHGEWLRAEAVVARSSILQPPSELSSRPLRSDTCDSTTCGPIRLIPVSNAVNEAVLSTAGETLWRGPQRASVRSAGKGEGPEDNAHAVGPKLSPAVLFGQRATAMACVGRSYRAMLHDLFPGTQVRIKASDEGWKQISRGGISFVSTTAPAPKMLEEAIGAWAMARSQFPPRQEVTPSVVFAPTTELFRQLTSQPGWQLASTSGADIVLQPAAVFEANHVSLGATLRHEMLHVATESSTSVKTPLWLREGIVEVLTGEARQGAPVLSAEDTERQLKNASTRQMSQAAHLAAGARARLLVEHYGFSAVRGWLVAGAPVPND